MINFHSKWWVLFVVQLGILLGSIDATLVVFALPTIASELHLDIRAVQWVSVAYTITCSSALPLAGKLADGIGRKQAYLIGFAIFTIASGLSGLVSNYWLLIALRMFTAFGTAFLLSSSSVIIVTVFPKEQHAFTLGLGPTVFSVGACIGLSLGGMLLHFAGWRWIFLINLPVGLLALLAGTLIFDANVLGRGKPRTHRLDMAGALALPVCITSLLVGLQALTAQQYLESTLLLALSLTVGWFGWREEHAAGDPILPPSLFAIREIRIGSVTRIIMRMAGAGAAFTLPFYLQRNLGLPPSKAGLVMLSSVLVFAIGGPLAGLAANRWGTFLVIRTGLIFLALGTALLALLPSGSAGAPVGPIVLIIGAQAIMGLGAALFSAPNTAAAMQAAPPAQRGITSGILWTTTFLGQALGASLAALLLYTGETGGTVSNLHVVFGALAVMVIVAVFLSQAPSPSPQRIKPVS